MKRVVVTGGSSGIGLATAKAYFAAGCDVAIVARDPDKLALAVASIESQRQDSSQRLISASADLSNFSQAKAVIDHFANVDMTPDILVNSAGVILPGEFQSMPVDHLTQNLESGFFSVLWPCRAAAPHMAARGSGHIVNVSSVAGFLGIYGYTGYSAAKYAAIGFSEALRCEMKPLGVSVHVVCPPDTETPALTAERAMRPPETEAIAGSIKPISPEVVAAAIVKGVKSGRFYIIPDATGRLLFRLKGLIPGLFFALIDADVRKARLRK